MPLIGDFKQKKTKKFVKKEYRPWDESLPHVPFKEIPEDIETNFEGKEKTSNPNPLSASLNQGTSLQDNEVSSQSTLENPIASVNEKQKETFSHPSFEEDQTIMLEKYARGLYGLQRGLLQIIIENISYCDNGFAIAKPLSGQDLSLSLKAPINSIKGSLQRLIKAKIIDIHDFKPGRGGFSCYKISESHMSFFKNHFEG